MDREYFQHAVQDAVTSAITITTRAIGIATSGMIAFYVSRGMSTSVMPSECLGEFIDQAWQISEVGSTIIQNVTVYS